MCLLGICVCLRNAETNHSWVKEERINIQLQAYLCMQPRKRRTQNSVAKGLLYKNHHGTKGLVSGA